ncbi:hypothetical protein [Butyrivibrio sp. WCD2001]|uniref:hypothetical protein n=1 Tax=Butyrivibrio sp. WCD2001 TaxID=1280681 RepID=UPI0003FBC214|nr:hypothetical protein [Butyrivibrio sp. WCD2001]
MNFIYVQYGGHSYPDGIKTDLVEVAGHFDKEDIPDISNYSLHTEYSYGKRKLNSDLMKGFLHLPVDNKDGVPQLWKSEEWAEEFARFIFTLTSEHQEPCVIEIHPPFNDYCDMEAFVTRYKVFESMIHRAWPDTPIVVENRAGSVYHGGKFILSKAQDIECLCKLIESEGIKLGVVLDFPQLLTGENIKPDQFDAEKYLNAIDLIYPYRRYVKGIHVWGKKKSINGRWVAHNGTLNDLFPMQEDKEIFLNGIKAICDDGLPRFLVPEVNSGADDLANVVRDVLF